MTRRSVVPALAGAAAAGRADTMPFALQFRDSFVRHWVVERDYTVAVADAMPPEQYDFKPNPVQRSFGEQLTHLAMANVAYFSAFGLLPAPERLQGGDRATAVKAVNSSWDYTLAVLRKVTEKDLLRSDLGPPRFAAQPLPTSACAHTPIRHTIAGRPSCICG